VTVCVCGVWTSQTHNYLLYLMHSPRNPLCEFCEQSPERATNTTKRQNRCQFLWLPWFDGLFLKRMWPHGKAKTI